MPCKPRSPWLLISYHRMKNFVLWPTALGYAGQHTLMLEGSARQAQVNEFMNRTTATATININAHPGCASRLHS